MSGTKEIVLQPRDHHLLRELSVMRVIDREQAKIVAGFHSTTRVNTRLLALTRAGFLRRFFLGSGGGRKAVYALSPKGAHAEGFPDRGPRRPHGALLVADNFVQHQLTVNSIYCTLKYGIIKVPDVTFHRWLGFYEPITPSVGLIPDGYTEFIAPSEIIACFLEVDLGHESLTVWKRKAQHYVDLALSGEFQKQFKAERFRVLVIANSERRLHSIRKAAATVTEKLFWFATLESVGSHFFDAVWFRPKDSNQKSLIQEPQ
jgi:hypothetical protein